MSLFNRDLLGVNGQAQDYATPESTSRTTRHTLDVISPVDIHDGSYVSILDMVTPSVQLNIHWNMIGNTTPYPITVLEAFAASGIPPEAVQIIKNSTGQFWHGGTNVDMLGSLQPGQGYLIYLYESGHTWKLDPTVLGTLTETYLDDVEDMSYDLNIHWNMIVSTSPTPITVLEAFAASGIPPEAVQIIKNSTGQFWHGGTNVDMLGSLQPGQGYLIYLYESGHAWSKGPNPSIDSLLDV